MTAVPPPDFQLGEDREEDLAVKHVLVDARSAPPISTQGVNSVFALADKEAESMAFDSQRAPVADAGDDTPVLSPAERLIKTLEACGELAAAKLAEAAGIKGTTLSFHLKPLLESGDVVKNGGGNATKYSLAKRGGFKGWLRRKGEESAEGRAPRKPKAVAKNRKAPAKRAATRKVYERTPKPAMTAPVATAMPADDEPDDLVCGIFSDGAMSIAAEGEGSMRLNHRRARKLVAWLEHAAKVVHAGAAK